nr:MAG TPA: esterase [Caudoviricetes sp.]
MNGLINRQYVGARYVPKVMGEWNKALQYEALSIVTYLGNSFTSKVPVPANIDISNKTYWVNTGNYNAQVEAYRQETAQLENHLNNEIIDRKNDTKDNILWIGDSYSVNYNHKLPNGVRNMLNAKNWYEYSKGGAGFAGAWAGASFNDLIELAKNEMSASQKEMIKYVYIVGGANDSSFSWVDIKPKVISTVKNARNSFPNAQVCFIFASCAYDTYQDLLTKTRYISNDNYVPCIFAMPHYYLGGVFYNTDNLHYTEEATNYIISVISNLLSGSTYIPTITADIGKACFEGWSSANQLQVTAPSGVLKISSPYLLLSKNTAEDFSVDEYGNTILLKSVPISDTKRTVFPLSPIRLFVNIKINNVIYNDYLECSLDKTTKQLVWTTDNTYPSTASMVMKIMS